MGRLKLTTLLLCLPTRHGVVCSSKRSFGLIVSERTPRSTGNLRHSMIRETLDLGSICPRTSVFPLIGAVAEISEAFPGEQTTCLGLYRSTVVAPTPLFTSHRLCKAMRAKVGEDQGSVEPVNRAVYATCGALIWHQGLGAEALALAEGRVTSPSKVITAARKLLCLACFLGTSIGARLVMCVWANRIDHDYAATRFIYMYWQLLLQRDLLTVE